MISLYEASYYDNSVVLCKRCFDRVLRRRTGKYAEEAKEVWFKCSIETASSVREYGKPCTICTTHKQNRGLRRYFVKPRDPLHTLALGDLEVS